MFKGWACLKRIMKVASVLGLLIVVLLGVGIYFQKEIFVGALHFRYLKTKGRFQLGAVARDILGQGESAKNGEVVRCGIVSLREPVGFKVYQADDKEMKEMDNKICLLENSKNKNQSIHVAVRTPAFKGLVDVVKENLTVIKEKTPNPFFEKVWYEIKNSKNYFEQHRVIFKSLDEEVGYFEGAENLYAVGTIHMVPFEYSGSKVATEYQELNGFVIQHIIYTNPNRSDTYFVFTPENEVFGIEFTGFDKNLDAEKVSYLKTFLVKDAIVIDREAQEQADADFEKDMEKMKKDFIEKKKKK